jgi:hypothetical protein
MTALQVSCAGQIQEFLLLMQFSQFGMHSKQVSLSDGIHHGIKQRSNLFYERKFCPWKLMIKAAFGECL